MHATPAVNKDQASSERPNDRRFLIHDPDKVWLIETGTVDLFLVRVERGEPVGAQSHVLRFEAGKALLGLEATSGQWQLLASLGPDARVVETSASRLREMASADIGGAVNLLEEWITSLSVVAAANLAPPKAFEALEAGREIVVAKDAKALLPREGLVWVSHSEGESRFLGSLDTSPIGPGVYFPVSAGAWLEAQPKSKLIPYLTRDVILSDLNAGGLRLFHQLALQALSKGLEQAEDSELQRLRKKSEAEQTRLDCAFRGLGAPLQARETAGLVGIGDPDLVLAACQIVGRHLGVPIRAHSDPTRETASAVDEIGRASGVRVRRVILAGTWWKGDSGPLVAFWEEGNLAVALIPSTSGHYILHDPAKQQTLKIDAKLAAKLAPYAYTFYRPLPRKKLNAIDLLVFGLRDSRRELLTILCMGSATGLSATVLPVATGILFDTVIPGASRTQLLQISGFLLATAACAALFHLVRGLAVLRLEGRMDGSIQAAVWDRLLSLPVGFFRGYTSGDLASRGLGIEQIRQILTGPALSSLLSGLFSIFSFALLFYYSWTLALLATVLVLIAVSVATVCGYLQLRRQREITRIRGRVAGLVLGLIGGISKLRVAGAENRAFAVWAAEFGAQKREAVRSRRISNSLTVFNSAFPVLCSLAIFYTMAQFVESPGAPAMTTGQFLAFYIAFGQFLAAALLLSSALVSVAGVVPLYERAKPILETLPEVDETKTSPGSLAGNIDVRHVSFRYRADGPLVLRNLSLNIEAGQFVAIVGSSGSGKSTLFRLLLGFEKPESGSIYYDGQDLGSLDIRSLRRQVGVVLQSSKLITANILQNIIGASTLTIDHAWEAARMSGFDQDIRAMPMGMHTVLSEGGAGLSGGQRQRLMIARAIVNKPRILLFDEATSALDNETQATVSRSLEQLQATRVVIAHRLSTIVNADRIFVLDKGSVVEAGTYAELMARMGLFAELAKRQLA